MTNYAQIDNRSAFLYTEFGEDLARKWFGDESVDSLPRYTRGPRKGKIKGAITWSKIVRGGWVRVSKATANGEATGYVETRVGRVFDRKLHETVSDRFGTSIGRVIRDLEREEADRKYKNSIKARVDEDIRKQEMERTLIEQIIVSGNFDQYNETFQTIINEKNEDIAVLINELQK